MPRLSPFTGLVFDAAVSGPLENVTAPPYDVISDRRRLEHLRASPFSVVHLDLAEGANDPAHPANRYTRAAILLRDWETRGALRRAPEPCYYAYEMFVEPSRAAPAAMMGGRAGARTVRGLICSMEIEEWGGTVLPHEEVREGPVQDRLALLRATRTHLSPVYGTLDTRDGRLDAFLRDVASEPAPFEVVDGQGVRHRMWPVSVGAAAQARLGGLEQERLLIADGHHRYTTALRYRAERRCVDGAGSWDSVMTLVVDSSAEHMPVMPLHRVQLEGEAVPAEGAVTTGLSETLSALDDDEVTIGTISRGADDEVGYRVRNLEGSPPTVKALHEALLDDLVPAWSLRYEADAAEADAAVRRGEAVAAYLLPPTTLGRIMALVERGVRLPQKSTYFWPKPLTGMVMMPLDPTPFPQGSSRAAQDRAAGAAANQTDRADRAS